MYAWKWWRESRNRAITYLILLVSIAVLFAWNASTQTQRPGDWAHGMPAVELWRLTLIDFGSIIIVFAALGLGASGVGEESAQGTVEFLLTRPRRRRYFVWTGWVAGAVTLFIMVALAVVASFIALVYFTKSAGTWKLLVVIVPLFVFGAVVYSLTYLMTALVKNGRAGLSLSLGLVLIGLSLPMAVHLRWRVDLPSPADVLAASKWATIPGMHFPLITTLAWSLVALAMPLATQFLLERAEV
jgi:ABC-type transport system involved in multi-copper enzyme maturation permease subunit